MARTIFFGKERTTSKSVEYLAAHDVDELGRQFEGRALEAEILGRRRQDEAEIDVDDVALAVEEDVAVVPVLDLDQVADERVGGDALDEIALRRQVGLRIGRAVLAQKVLEQRHARVLLDLVQRHRVQDRLDHPRVVRQHQDPVRPTTALGVSNSSDAKQTRSN